MEHVKQLQVQSNFCAERLAAMFMVIPRCPISQRYYFQGLGYKLADFTVAPLLWLLPNRMHKYWIFNWRTLTVFAMSGEPASHHRVPCGRACTF